MTQRWRFAVAAAVAAAGVALFVLELDNPAFSVARLCLVVSVGLAMVGAGLVASANGEDRIGMLVVLAGAAWLAERLLQAIPTGLTATIGFLLTGLWAAFLFHAIVTFPSGRPASRFEGAVIGTGYIINVGLTLPYLLALPSLELVGLPQDNVIALFPNADAARWMDKGADWLTLGWVTVVVGLVVAKAIAASPVARRAYGFVWVAGCVYGINGMVLVGAGLGIGPEQDVYGLWLEIIAAIVPITLAASLFAARVAEDRLVALVADLEIVGPGSTLRNALRRSLADPTLDIVYIRSGSSGWIDEVGHPMTVPVAVAGRALTPIERGGKPIAALVHDPVLLRNPERLRAASSAASLALDNAQLKAELRAQLIEMRASRARILEAGDNERRRVERNLHDGAQQRLVGLALMLRLASRKAEGDPAVTELLTEAAGELDQALVEVREVARGLHPAIVTGAGLPGALETLAELPGVPVDLHVDLPGRLAEHVEVGAYYLVAEALANANKHASADRVTVRATVVDEALRVTVSDDGRGGAAATPGSGLEGLADRVSALGGRLDIDSGADGTTLGADIPLRVEPAPGVDPRRLTALRWIGWESFELPGEAYDQLTDEDNLTYMKAVVLCAGGPTRVTQHELDWLVGYHTAAGDADWVLDAIRAYNGSERIEDIIKQPSMALTGRALIYDTMRMCSSDGALTSVELDCVHRAAFRMGLSRDLVDDLHDIVTEERALRQRRYELITAPVLPVA